MQKSDEQIWCVGGLARRRRLLGKDDLGLGTAVSRSNDRLIRNLAGRGLERAMSQRSPWPRAMAFAALGAAEVLQADPGNSTARALLSDAADTMTALHRHDLWPWPEERLTYANATLPEAMIAAGSVLELPLLTARGLELLEWLLTRETREGHLSVTPAGGSGPDDEGPGFDQQPIEVAALADACARAKQWTATGSGRAGSQRPPIGFSVTMTTEWSCGTQKPVAPLMASKRPAPTSIRARSRHSLSLRHCSTHGLN